MKIEIRRRDTDKSADLRGAKFDEPLQPETILIFWKYLKNGENSYQNLNIKVGEIYTCDNFDTNENILCGWC